MLFGGAGYWWGIEFDVVVGCAYRMLLGVRVWCCWVWEYDVVDLEYVVVGLQYVVVGFRACFGV